MSATATGFRFQTNPIEVEPRPFPRCHVRMIIGSTLSEPDRSTGPVLATSEPFEVPAEVAMNRPIISALARKCELPFQFSYRSRTWVRGLSLQDRLPCHLLEEDVTRRAPW